MQAKTNAHLFFLFGQVQLSWRVVEYRPPGTGYPTPRLCGKRGNWLQGYRYQLTSHLLSVNLGQPNILSIEPSSSLCHWESSSRGLDGLVGCFSGKVLTPKGDFALWGREWGREEEETREGFIIVKHGVLQTSKATSVYFNYSNCFKICPKTKTPLLQITGAPSSSREVVSSFQKFVL